MCASSLLATTFVRGMRIKQFATRASHPVHGLPEVCFDFALPDAQTLNMRPLDERGFQIRSKLGRPGILLQIR